MDVRRTAVVKLTVSDEQRDAPSTEPPSNTCTARTEPLITVGPTPLTPSVRPTSERCVTLYSKLREETDLQAQLVQAAIKRAVEAVKACVERWKNGQRVSQPTFTAETMDYDTRSATFYRNKVSLATVEDESNRRSFSRQTVRRPTSGTYSL